MTESQVRDGLTGNALLIEINKSQGFVTDADIKEAFPSYQTGDLDVDEETMAALREADLVYRPDEDLTKTPVV